MPIFLDEDSWEKQTKQNERWMASTFFAKWAIWFGTIREKQWLIGPDQLFPHVTVVPLVFTNTVPVFYPIFPSFLSPGAIIFAIWTFSLLLSIIMATSLAHRKAALKIASEEISDLLKDAFNKHKLICRGIELWLRRFSVVRCFSEGSEFTARYFIFRVSENRGGIAFPED